MLKSICNNWHGFISLHCDIQVIISFDSKSLKKYIDVRTNYEHKTQCEVYFIIIIIFLLLKFTASIYANALTYFKYPHTHFFHSLLQISYLFTFQDLHSKIERSLVLCIVLWCVYLNLFLGKCYLSISFRSKSTIFHDSYAEYNCLILKCFMFLENTSRFSWGKFL